jgi:sialic acid synthase SpsE
VAQTIIAAEIGSNHGGDPALAEAMVEAAAKAGATAVKFQAFRAETLAHPESPYYEELASEAISFSALERLVRLARRLGLLAGLTVFDPGGLALAERSGADYVKISSGDLTFHPLIRLAARSQAPLVLSTGAALWPEAARALALAPRPLALLQCASIYPAPFEAVNLAVMDRWLRAGLPAGLSDHAPALGASLAAARLGAAMVERHMTIDRGLPGGDNSISSLPEDFRRLSEAASMGPLEPRELDEIASAPFWGSPEKALQDGERPDLIRRVMVAAADLKAGQTAEPPRVAYLRPPASPPPRPLGPDGALVRVMARPVARGAVVAEDDALPLPEAGGRP